MAAMVPVQSDGSCLARPVGTPTASTSSLRPVHAVNKRRTNAHPAPPPPGQGPVATVTYTRGGGGVRCQSKSVYLNPTSPLGPL